MCTHQTIHCTRIAHRRGRAFSLLELLCVLAVMSLLASLLLPVFMTARGKAREIVCVSNLRQIGLAFAAYNADYDGFYPYAIDPADRATPILWSETPEFQALIPVLPMVHQVLQPYSKSPALFHCPGDVGFSVNDWTSLPMDGLPSSYEKYGTSYYYRTEIAARRAHDGSIVHPTEINLLFDGAGHWHGTLTPLMKRYNILFADGHVKNLTRSQAEATWKLPLLATPRNVNQQ